MKKPLVAALAVAAGLVAAGAALASYAPTLAITSAGPKTTIRVSQPGSDDATAKVSIYAPTGYTVTLGQPVGAKLGTVKAQVLALLLGGALLPLTGDVVVDDPAKYAANACAPGTHEAVWNLVLTAAGQTLQVPVYVDRAAGAEASFASLKIQTCLPPPDIPPDKGGATFGAKLILADFSVTGVLAGSASGVWRTLWTPYQAGNGQVNAAGTVEARSTVQLPVAVNVAAKARKVTGTVTAGGAGVTGAKVEIWAGTKKNALKRVGAATTKAGGAFSFNANRAKATFFQAKAMVAPRADAAGCSAPGPFPVPCVSATFGGFVATSAVVKGR